MATTLNLQDILYDKNYECPVCQNTFYSKSIRTGKNQVTSTDRDLYSHYSVVNPLLYEVLSCPDCGYTALAKTFETLLPTQIKWIQEQMVSKYKKRPFSAYTSVHEALTKHQLALACCIIKKGKIGEQAYICLHIAWLYRDLKDEEGEKLYLKKALDGFKKALETENFPIFSLDALTTTYIISAIAYDLKDYATAKSYLSEVLYSSTGQLKNRALDLKQLIYEAENETTNKIEDTIEN